MLTIAIVTALSAATPAAAANDDNVVRCKRETITGTLAQTRRICHTVAEWRRINRDSGDEAARVIMPQGRWSAESIN